MAKANATVAFRYPRWDGHVALSHNANMVPAPHRWFLREWRTHRGYTLERLAEMVGMSVGYLSDLEKGKRRWNQDHLEAFATALQCEPADLIIRDPSDPDGIWSIWDQLKPAERQQVVEIAKTLKRTGTGG
jgi:transcriptional regulator with XRE-family HTH domain